MPCIWRAEDLTDHDKIFANSGPECPLNYLAFIE